MSTVREQERANNETWEGKEKVKLKVTEDETPGANPQKKQDTELMDENDIKRTLFQIKLPTQPSSDTKKLGPDNQTAADGGQALADNTPIVEPNSSQEKAAKSAWAQRQQQSAPMQSMPEQMPGGKAEASSDGTGENEEENEEPETVEDEDLTKRELYQEQLSKQKQQSAQMKDATVSAEESGEGEAEEPSKDNLILFFAALFVAGAKDLLDLIGIETFGLLGTFVNIFISGVFALILLLRGSKLNNSKTIIRYVIAGIAEFIPVVNFLPMWTISVLWEKLEKKLPASMQVVSKIGGDAGQKNQPTVK
ncbi:MAG: hypothetical protein V1668_01090 [Patescibacteria group bacterium]